MILLLLLLWLLFCFSVRVLYLHYGANDTEFFFSFFSSFFFIIPFRLNANVESTKPSCSLYIHANIDIRTCTRLSWMGTSHLGKTIPHIFVWTTTTKNANSHFYVKLMQFVFRMFGASFFFRLLLFLRFLFLFCVIQEGINALRINIDLAKCTLKWQIIYK